MLPDRFDGATGDVCERFEVAFRVSPWNPGGVHRGRREIFRATTAERLARLAVAKYVQGIRVLLRPQHGALRRVHAKTQPVFLAGRHLAAGQDTLAAALEAQERVDV